MRIKGIPRMLHDRYKEAIDGIIGQNLRTSPFSPDYWTNGPVSHHLEKTIDRFGGGVILDVGCGAFGYAALYDRPEVEVVVGADLAPERPEIELSNTWGCYICADGIRLPLPTGVADLVVATSVFQYVETPSQFTDELYRVTTPGGHIIMSVPFLLGLHGTHDLWRPTQNGLERLLIASGFLDVDVQPVGGTATALGVLCTRWLWRKARGTDAPDWKKILLRFTAWPAVLPVILLVNAASAVGQALMPDDTSPPMLFATARRPPG